MKEQYNKHQCSPTVINWGHFRFSEKKKNLFAFLQHILFLLPRKFWHLEKVRLLSDTESSLRGTLLIRKSKCRSRRHHVLHHKGYKGPWGRALSVSCCKNTRKILAALRTKDEAGHMISSSSGSYFSAFNSGTLRHLYQLSVHMCSPPTWVRGEVGGRQGSIHK